MAWDYVDRLHATARRPTDGGDPTEATYYVYDVTGQRIRKVTGRAGNEPDARKAERIYIGAFEVFREYGPDGTVTLERETLQVFDDKHRIALIETRTVGTDRGPGELIRYQLANHLDSAVLELDQRAQVISYEEYYPYGSTSYQAVRAGLEAPKRYRYTGKERDTETGLYYHGARYYAPGSPAGSAATRRGWSMAPTSTPTLAGIPSSTPTRPVPNATRQSSHAAKLKGLRRGKKRSSDHYRRTKGICLPRFPAPPRLLRPPRHRHRRPPRSGSWDHATRESRPTRGPEGPSSTASEYTKPYAMEYAAQGDYEAAELAEHYMCPTCHVLTQVNPHDFSLGGYVRGYQKASIQGLVEAPLAATPIGAAWEIGVSGGQALTGEGSGLHISNISSVLVDGKSDLGTTLPGPAGDGRRELRRRGGITGPRPESPRRRGRGRRGSGNRRHERHGQPSRRDGRAPARGDTGNDADSPGGAAKHCRAGKSQGISQVRE